MLSDVSSPSKNFSDVFGESRSPVMEITVRALCSRIYLMSNGQLRPPPPT